MKESVDLIEQIIQEGAISDANLRLPVDIIVISEKNKNSTSKSTSTPSLNGIRIVMMRRGI